MSKSNYSTPLIALDAVVLDLETTGLDARIARVVQIGAVHIREGRIEKDRALDQIVDPGIQIPTTAISIHGITDEMAGRALPFKGRLDQLETFLGDAVVVGHTIDYDLTILEREYALADRIWRPPHALDVRLLARIAAPTLVDHSLDRLCEWLNVSNQRRHSAIGDAVATAEVFLALIPILRERNIRTLAEAEAAVRQQAEADARHAGGFATASLPSVSAQSRPLVRIDSFPYRHRVRDVMSTPPVFADAQTSVRDGIQVLIEKAVSSVYVRDPNGVVGIATERDMLRAINAQAEAGLDARLGEIMSKPLQTVPEDAFVYRAIGRLDRLGFRHLGVTDARGEIVGAVTTRNLLRHRATAAVMLGDEIDSAPSVAALAAAWAKLPLMARGLIAEDVDPRVIAAVISAEIREFTRRAAQLAEAKLSADGLGSPPCPYAVLVLGSAGRGESLLAADQDNAIVYERGDESGPEDRWFEALGIEMCNALHEIGVPLCKGGVMASNRAWRMSLKDWKHTVDGWIRRQRPEDLLNVDIFFDALTAHGDVGLGEAIWDYAYARGQRAPDFIKLMIEVARQRAPAFTLFGNIRVDEKGRADLKRAGLLPISTCARVLSIRHGVLKRSTPERLLGIAAKGIASPEEIDGIIEAHRTILGTILDQQLADTEFGSPLSTRINPDRLGKSRKRAVAAALGKVDSIIDLVSEGRM